jgi:hypothetical protein
MFLKELASKDLDQNDQHRAMFVFRVDLIINQISVRIGKRQDHVVMVMLVSLFMIVVIINKVGNWILNGMLNRRERKVS